MSTLTEPQLSCEICRQPGQLRHAPPPSPVSGIWCDRCFARMESRASVWQTLYRWRLLLFVIVVTLMVWGKNAWAQAPSQTLQVAIGDRVEYTKGGQLERGTVTGLYKVDASGAAESFYVTQDRTNLPNQYVQVWLHKPRKLNATAANIHTAPPMRARAPCPAQQARQGSKPSPDLVRALIQCRLEDNTGTLKNYTVNVDITEFRMGQVVRNSEMSNSLVRYAAADTWVANAFVRYNTRWYGSSDVTAFAGSEGPFMVYMDLDNRWVVGNGYIKKGEQSSLALPR